MDKMSDPISRAMSKMKPYKSKMKLVMGEFKRGGLHSGSKKGPKVKSRKQAIAIAMNQARKAAS